MELSLFADVLNDFEAASEREWLVTNGLGGYASGSLSGANTRRYHGLLVAALTAPTGRHVLLGRVEESVSAGGAVCALSTSQYPGAICPEGYRCQERFDAWPAPTFLYRIRPGLRLSRRIWMARGRNTTYLQYRLDTTETAAKEELPALLRLSPLVCWKDYHTQMHPWSGFPLELRTGEGEVAIRFTADSPTLRLLLSGASWEPAGCWYYNIEQARERERGMEYLEDLYCPGHYQIALTHGQSVTLIATLESEVEEPNRNWQRLCTRQSALLAQAGVKDDFARKLVLAADSFLIGASAGEERLEETGSAAMDALQSVRKTVIAGYPWFTDWGRDTMISLPGLCLATGRVAMAWDILQAFAGFVSEGMLPNRFPDQGESAEYNNADGTLWYFQALWECVQHAIRHGSHAMARVRIHALWPVLTGIIDRHVAGTRYGIRVDPVDGLLHAGESDAPATQLTWMDARIGDWAVTPRVGKPVEINALWYNALQVMAELSEMAGAPAERERYQREAERVRVSFQAGFVRPDGGGLYDVLTADGPDASLRPNQIFAVSLPFSPLVSADQERVVQTVADRLLTPFGLRTLAPEDPSYCPRYGGNPRERDGAYHQGTVWPWLLGPFVRAHSRLYGITERSAAFLRPLEAHLWDAGIGSISEIFDGEPPHRPNGCIAQAWSVAQVLSVWTDLLPQRDQADEACGGIPGSTEIG